MKYCEVHMDSLHLNRNDLLDGLLKKREVHLPKAHKIETYYWDAESYGLDQLKSFREAPNAIKQSILTKLSQLRLEEAYHIEKAGIAFGAKMVLESTTFEERKLYAHFTAEESEHLAMIESYITHVSDEHLSNDFLIYLSELIKNAPKDVLVFMIQVVLEGWGIEHYSELAKTCNNDHLQKSLKKIVLDEAGHHGSGMLLFQESRLTTEHKKMINQALGTFLSMVRVGPYALMTTLTQYLKLDSKQIQSAIITLNATQDTNKKLQTLKTLALRSGASEIISDMDALNLYSVKEEELMSLYGEMR